MTLPDFIIIGAPKSGTTAMKSNFNKHHPSIWLGGRENNFFNMHWDKGLDWYTSQFPGKTREGVLYGEKTPSYIYGLDAPNVEEGRRYCHERMQAIVPDAKLILCLRNPAERAYSHWHMESVNRKGYRLSFEEALALDLEHMKDPDYVRFTGDDFVQKGFYMDYIENLLNHYPREQLHVCITEELKTDVVTEYNKIYAFLGLGVVDDSEYRVSSTPYKSKLDPAVHAQLDAIYQPYNQRLFEFLGRDVAAWERA